LYQAKQAGRATAITFQPGMSIWPSSRVGLERDLRHAIERGELSLVYQPIFDVVSMRVLSLEALLRWNHPIRGVVTPGEFLSIAEETGLSGPIGSWTIEEACRQFRQWRAIAPRLTPTTINVNLSRRQLRDPELFNRIVQALAVSSLDPAFLCLEIAEETLIDDLREISGVLRELRDLGIRFAIDDFGAGATSLASLRELPVEDLKLDQSFIRPLGFDQEENADIVAAVTALAHRLGMTVTAEGVETQTQLEAVRRAGCDRAQGYLIGRPVPANDVLALLWRASPLVTPVAHRNAVTNNTQSPDAVPVVRELVPRASQP
jgi:EAL domain-containing protein (putative c-di-GMP-specific phosphodiesterase class I)